MTKLYEQTTAHIHQVKPYPKNAKQHPQSQIDMLCLQIADGWDQPIVVDADFVIIKGHGRLLAAQQMGITEVPVIIRDDLTPEQVKAIRIADNKLAETDWDMELLIEELSELVDSGVEANYLGYDEAELNGLLDGLDSDWGDGDQLLDAEDDDYEIPDEITTDIKLGDLFEIGTHRLLCGDSTDKKQVLTLMDGCKADMVFTDPPYNVAFNGRSGKFDVIENDNLSSSDFSDLIRAFSVVLTQLSPNNYYIWCNWKFYGILQEHLPFKACIVWAKNVFGLGRGYRHQHEFCLFNGTLDDGINNESDLWNISKDTNYKHPTQKPVALALRALNNHKRDRNIVDLFLGSGSTMLACHQVKRKCYGMELDPKYCQVIIERMLKLDSSLTVKKNGKNVTDEFLANI